jgi:Rrf2 family protein
MDLQLTRRGDYAVRAALSLARASGSGEYHKLRDVSSEMAIPLRYTQEILGLLMRAGLAEARAGKQGGYRLTRRPADISLLAVVEAAEGPLRSERCIMSGGPCHWQDSVCAVHAMWEEASQALTTSLRGRSLATVLEVDDRLRNKSSRRSKPPARRDRG